MKKISREEHIARYGEFHKCLDELLADFFTHTERWAGETTLLEFIEWSYTQTKNPTEAK